MQWKRDWDEVNLSFFDRLAGNTAIRKLIDKGAAIADIMDVANEGKDNFIKKIADCLHYRRQQ